MQTRLSTVRNYLHYSGWFYPRIFVFFCDGLDTGIIGFVAPALLDDWGITKPQLAPVLSAALVGMSIGAIISGPLADKFGRKGVIVLQAFCFPYLPFCVALPIQLKT